MSMAATRSIHERIDAALPTSSSGQFERRIYRDLPMRISGTWQGQYTYGAVYGTITGLSVPFRLSLHESWWFGRVRGHVRDDVSKGGQLELGNVDGWRKRTVVRFVKVMPVNYVVTDGGLTPFQDWLLQAHGITALGAMPPQWIGYRGTVSDDGRAMIGEWEILPRPLQTDRGVVHTGNGAGTWTASHLHAKRTSL